MTRTSILHPFNTLADPDGGYAIEYPDLPGCITQVESIDEVGPAAQEIHELWIAAALENGTPIPPATFPESYSGKFLLRVPKSLHRRLVERARLEGVSLNQLAQSILAEALGASPPTIENTRESRDMFVAETTSNYKTKASI